MDVYGGIEAGGTKFVCGAGTGPEDLVCESFATESPEATLGRVAGFFRGLAVRPRGIGIGSFGPVDLDRGSPTFGFITSTPKAGWRQFDLAGAVGRGLDLPVAFDTDVNAAALGEARWGAARGLTDFLYVTVGTGIGGGAVANGRAVHGLVHPEMGHIRIPHDLAEDPYPGGCPYHGDCLEGLASGPAMQARWGMRAESLPEWHPAWDLEARYLALGLATWVCTLSPRRIVLGGGVMRHAALFPAIRAELGRLLNGYVQAADVVPPKLGERAGVLGALALAETRDAERRDARSNQRSTKYSER